VRRYSSKTVISYLAKPFMEQAMKGLREE